MKRKSWTVLVGLALALGAYFWLLPKRPPFKGPRPAMPEKLDPKVLARIGADYRAKIEPIFKKACFDCHTSQTVWPWYHALSYISPMNLAYACANVAVCRSGAATCAELAIQQVPAILVPLPTASEDHQAYNAQALVDLGAARLVRQGEQLVPQLVQELRTLLLQPELRRQLQANLALAAVPDAAQRLAQEIESTLGVGP